MFRISPTRQARDSERGYFLIAAIFAVTLMIIALAASLPAIKGQIKRDREEELIHRGHQYTRAIQLFYRKFGRYPNSIDDLVDTNNIRFLRDKYKDPVTGKDEWRLIHYGEAQPKPLPPYINRPGGGGGGGGTPAGGISSGVSTAGATNASDMSSRLSSSTTNSPGVGPIVGVASTSDQTAMKEVDGKTKYSDWEFVYDPSLDPSRGGANNGQGQGNGLGNGNNNGGRGNQNNLGNPGGNPNPTPRPPGGR